MTHSLVVIPQGTLLLLTNESTYRFPFCQSS